MFCVGFWCWSFWRRRRRYLWKGGHRLKIQLLPWWRSWQVWSKTLFLIESEFLKWITSNPSSTWINNFNWILDPTWTLAVEKMDEVERRNLVGAARMSPHRPAALRASPKPSTNQLSSRPFHSLSCQKISDLCAASNRQGLSPPWLTKSDPWQTPSRNLRKRLGET